MIVKIKDKLRSQTELITQLLVDIGQEKIKPPNSKGDIRWGGNNGSKINIDTLYYESFSHSQKGDVLVMVSYIKSLKLGDAIRWLADYLGIKYEYNKTEVVLPFGGFFKQYTKSREFDDNPPKTYPIERLKEYNNGLSLIWIKDNISALVQEEFDIGYDILTNRITIPWLDECGDLVGIMGRLHADKVEEWQNKYLPVIAFNKSKVLYGYYQNYRNILDENCIIIVESEKSVLKAREYGYKNVVALGGNIIHKRHERLIKSLYCNVIIALDEGLELSHCIEQAKKLMITNPFFSNEVYIMDMTDAKEKSCIFDLDEEIIRRYFKESLIYIG